ncbi:MAG: prenyltransferase [bacterium]|nr:MAG: prenyltransferase [bacterium]
MMVENKENPSLAQMIRAPFFSSILAPIFAGTLLSVIITDQFNIYAFFLVTVMGLTLHTATNVYNDIYDTLQGTDKINRHRNEFSGGSGLIIQFPHILPKMYRIARISLVVALLCTIGLMFLVKKALWPTLWGLYVLSAFFSKYYTAAPVKLASRGWGEISVWFAFGPMAILVAAVSQNVGFHPIILLAMPLTGISTLSILLVGQLIDLPADKEAGKWGVAVRRGSRFTAALYTLVQIILILNVVVLAWQLGGTGWIILICLLPYLLFFPKVVHAIFRKHDNPAALRNAAGLNVQIHMVFSLQLVVGLALVLLI